MAIGLCKWQISWGCGWCSTHREDRSGTDELTAVIVDDPLYTNARWILFQPRNDVDATLTTVDHQRCNVNYLSLASQICDTIKVDVFDIYWVALGCIPRNLKVVNLRLSSKLTLALIGNQIMDHDGRR